MTTTPQQMDWIGEASFSRTMTHAPTPRARRADPDTSRAAAANAAEFAGDHERRILAAIKAAGERGATAKEIARTTGLTDVQVNRRLHAMTGIERRLRKDAASDRDFERREGCAIWWAR